jgi:eukaryotic-like serine/threonine-protein kinase
MTLAEGSHLGPYSIVSPLGAGGMGEVYRATDSRLKRQVAIKILPSGVAADPDRLARFQREAEVLASLNHPHIAAIYGLEEANEVKALVMELVEGPTLADRITQGAVPLDEALPIARQIAAALAAAHERGIIHRDLKPANIKVRQDGTVKVLDFGLAKLATSSGASIAGLSQSATLTSPVATPAVTTMGLILGTAAYMSPEQARGREVDKRTDIWAFGAVLYEMLTAARAFPGEDVTETMAAVVKSTPEWSALPADTPPSVVSLIQRCLEKDRHARIGDIAVAQFLLSDSSSSSASGISAVVAPASTKAGNTAAPWMVRVLPLVVAALALGVAGGWLLGRRPAVTPAAASRLQMSVSPAEQLTSSNVSFRPVRHAIAISPDGRVAVFTGSRGNVAQLYARALERDEATPIPGTEGGVSPFFSADGASIGFWVGSTLKRVPIAGGQAATIAEIADGGRGSATWADDGTIFVANGAGISSVSSTGGTPTSLVASDRAKNLRHLLPHALPGGKAIVFTTVAGGGWETANIVLLSVESGEQRVLVKNGADARYVDTGHLVYAKTGTLMAVPFDLRTQQVGGSAVAVIEDVMQSVNTPNTSDETGAAQFSVSRSGTLVYLTGGVTPNLQSSFEWIDRNADKKRVADVPAGSYLFPRLSPDGQRVAVNVRRPASRVTEVWVYDLLRAAPTRITFEQNNSSPIWSPDGKRLVFNRDAEVARNLYVISADGSGKPERLGTSDFTQIPSSWNAATGLVAFMQRPSLETTGIWVLPVDSRPATPKLFLESRFFLSHAEFSPDGRWMAYVSNESGGREVYVQPYPGPGEKIRVSTDSSSGGTEPVWAPSGRELLYRGFGSQRGVFSVTISSLSPFRVAPPKRIVEMDTNEYSSTAPIRSWSVSPDGQRFLVSPLERMGQPITTLQVVLNWSDELRRLVPSR